MSQARGLPVATFGEADERVADARLTATVACDIRSVDTESIEAQSRNVSLKLAAGIESIGGFSGRLNDWGIIMKKSLVATLLCSVSIVGVSAGSAFAGEITGQGRGTPLISTHDPVPEENVGAVEVMPSLCAFSGLNDDGPTPQTPKGAGSFTAIACGGSGGGRVFED